ncbi:Regulatory protein soxS [Klebsiella pneumoniae]|nr:Regulatory protein soxS [Klebsiella pneumoniae]
MGLAAIMRSKTLQQSVLSDLLLWIDNNLDKKLTVDDLSDISGYSPWHLFRLFRHYFDRSPMEYIRQQRMSLCCRLLLTTPGYRIVDICMMVGYDDLSAFNRTFKKISCAHAHSVSLSDHAAKIRRSPSSASLRLGMEGGQGILQKGNSRMLLSSPVGINDLARRKSV